MKYVLNSSSSGSCIAEAEELADNFAAEQWAKQWVKDHAREDRYILERDDARFKADLFRTHAGQWYLAPSWNRSPRRESSQAMPSRITRMETASITETRSAGHIVIRTAFIGRPHSWSGLRSGPVAESWT